MTLHGTLVVIGAVLLTVQCLKLAGVLSAIRWIVANGEDFITALDRREGEFSESLYWRLLDQTRGREVFPFGVLEYRLLRYAASASPLVRRSLATTRFLVYDFVSIGVAVMLFLFLAGLPALRHETGGSVAGIAWASGCLAAIQLVAIYAEACVSYARIGSYGLGWHGASRYPEKQRNGAYLTEVATLAGAVFYSLGIGCLFFYFAAGHGARFERLTVTHTATWGVGSDLLGCLYYSLVTFFTADTPGPVNGPARLATAVPVVQAVCALILAFTTATMYLTAESRSGRSVTDADDRPAGEAPAPRHEVAPPAGLTAPRRGDVVVGLIAGAVLGTGIAAILGRARRHRSRGG